MRKSTKKYSLLAIAGLSSLALLSGCSSGSTGGESDQSANISTGALGPAEDTEITVVIPFPDPLMYSLYYVGTELGYYKDEGLKVKVISSDNVNAAVAGGSADIGVASAGAVVEAVRKHVGVAPLAGHFCQQTFNFATAPGVKSVKDLKGKNIVLAGTSGDPAQFQRAKVLKDNGWDLDKVDANIVFPGPDSSTWREFLVNGRVSLIPFYSDDLDALEKSGANIIVKSLKPWANDLHVANADWLKENPNSAIRFLRATMKAAKYQIAPGPGELPEHKEKILQIFEDHDFDVTDMKKNETPWVFDGEMICPNLNLDKEAWQTTIKTQHLEPLDFASNVDLAYLKKAQKLLGLDNSGPQKIPFP